MDLATESEIVEKICRIVNHATDPSSINYAKSKQKVRVFSSESDSFALVGEIAFDFENLTKRLLEEEKWSDKFSEKFIEEAIKDLVFKIRKDPKAAPASDFFHKLTEHLDEYFQKTTVYIVINNVVMDENEVALGNVVLTKMTDIVVDALISENSEQSPFLTYLNELKGKVCAVYSTFAEPEKARQRAEEESRRAIDLLHYSAIELYPDGLNIIIGLEGEALSASRATFVFPSNAHKPFVQLERIGALTHFELIPAHVAQMEGFGTFKLSVLLTKRYKSLKPVERSLLRGVRWLSNSQIQLDRQSKLLSLITCLENIVPKNGQNIKEATSKGAATIYVDELVDPEHRERTKESLQNWINNVYEKRSTITHGGHVDISDEELITLKRIAYVIIRWITKKCDFFENRTALFKWIQDQKPMF